jgi:hypothetical protein
VGESGCRTARKSAYGVNWCVFEPDYPDLTEGHLAKPSDGRAGPGASLRGRVQQGGVAVNSLWQTREKWSAVRSARATLTTKATLDQSRLMLMFGTALTYICTPRREFSK